MNTLTNTEMSTISSIMIANNHYTIYGLRKLVNSYNCPELSLALDCVMEEGTIDTIIEFFITSPHVYPEAQEQNNMHNHHVAQKRAIMLYTYGSTAQVGLVPESMVQPDNAGPIHAIAEKLMFN